MSCTSPRLVATAILVILLLPLVLVAGDTSRANQEWQTLNYVKTPQTTFALGGLLQGCGSLNAKALSSHYQASGSFRTSCASDADCPAGYKCMGGWCLPQPSAQCTDGEVKVWETCPDGSPKRWQVCYMGQWTYLTEDCPVPQVCSEGAVNVLEMCPDGSTWKHRQVCRNNAWVDEYQQCPTPTPTCSGGQYWNGQQCVCPSGQNWNGQQCIQCSDGQIWTGSQCACPSGQNWNGQQCVTQPSCPYGGTYPNCNPPPTSAKIASFSVSPSELKDGDVATAAVNVQNTGNVRWTYYVGFSVQDRKGKWWDAPHTTVTIDPGGSATTSLRWTVDGSAPFGAYLARAAVYKSASGGVLTEQLDMQDKAAAFIHSPTEQQLQVLVNDIKKYVDFLTSEDMVKLMLEKAETGTTELSTNFNVSPETDTAFDVGAKEITIALEISYLVSLVNNANESVNDKIADLQKYMGSATKSAIITILCLVILTPTTGPGALACGLLGGATELTLSLVLTHINDRINQLIGSIWTRIIDWMNLLFKKILKVFGGSSVDLLIVDPSGRRAGATIENGQWVLLQEIPNAYYSGLGTHPQYIAVPDPDGGTFRVIVSGNQTGDYHLSTSMIVNAEAVSEQNVTGSVAGGASQEHQVLLVQGGQVFVDPSPFTIFWYQLEPASGYIVILVSAVVTALIVLIGSEVILRRRRKR